MQHELAPSAIEGIRERERNAAALCVAMGHRLHATRLELLHLGNEIEQSAELETGSTHKGAQAVGAAHPPARDAARVQLTRDRREEGRAHEDVRGRTLSRVGHRGG